MIEFEHRIQINRAPAEVFALLRDVDRLPEWQKSVVFVENATHAPVSTGSEFVQTWKGLGGKRRVPTRVAMLRNDELIAFSGDAGFADFYCAFEVQPATDRGTTLITRAEFRLHGLWRLLRPMLGGELRRELRSEIAELKRLVEAPTPEAGHAPA